MYHTFKRREIQTLIVNFIFALRNQNNFVIDFFNDLHSTGCRWVELYEVSRWQYYDPDYYTCQCAKGGLKRYVPTRSMSTSLLSQINSSVDFNNFCRYDKMTRIMNKYIAYPDLKVGHKDVTLHLFRHFIVKQLTWEKWKLADISKFIGEVDNDNTKGYLDSIVYTDLY